MLQQLNPTAIRLERPTAGAIVTVRIDADAMKLILGFEPDPNAVVKNGRNLEFVFDDGGKVVLEGYYDHFADKTLPVMVTEAGEELSGEDFLASLREDLLTAAGSGAGSGSGGAGDYTDDAGSLIEGIGRLGSLDMLHWSRETLVPEEFRNMPELPGVLDVAVLAPLGTGGFALGVFEDWRPDQNSGDPSPLPAQIYCSFAPADAAVVTNVAMSGFTAGARIIIGDPDAPEQVIDITGPAMQVNFTYEQLTVIGVHVRPPANDDTDMSIVYSVDLTVAGTGLPTTISGAFVALVDAVADLPVIEDAAVNAQLAVWRQAFSSETEAEGASGMPVGETTAVFFPVRVAFDDLDGSEAHYIKLAGIPEDWTPDAASLAALGLAPVAVPADRAWHEDAPTVGVVTHVFQVVDQAVYESGLVSGAIRFDTGDWTSGRLNNGRENPYGDAEITVSAIAWEGNGSDGEITLANNYAETEIGSYTVKIVEDRPVFITGDDFSILSDETSGCRFREGGEEAELPTAQAVAAAQAIAGLEIPLSHAGGMVAYNLFSDGVNDPFPTDNSQAAVTLELPPAYKADPRPCGWKTGDGQDIYLFEAEGGHLVGRAGGPEGGIAFVVTVTDAGLNNGENNATVSFFQYMNLQHPEPDGGPAGACENPHGVRLLDDLALTLALYDDEGDRTRMTVTLNVRDEGPKLLLTPCPAVVSETDLVTGTDPGPIHYRNDVSGNLADETKFLGQLVFSFGADGPYAPTGTDDPVRPFTWNIADLEGKYLSGGEDVHWMLEDNGLIAIGYVLEGTVRVPVITLTAELNVPGAWYTVKLDGPLDHSRSQDHDWYGEHGFLNRDMPELLPVGIGFTVTDSDGDSSSGNLTVMVRDDLPCAGHCEIGTFVLEASLRPEGGGLICARGDLHVEFGADGPADPASDRTPGIHPVAWDYDNIDVSGLRIVIGNTAVDAELTRISATEFEIRGKGHDEASVTVKIEADGKGGHEYVYTQKHALAHSNKGIIDNIVKDLEFKYTVTDGDGDTAGNTLRVNVVDSILHLGGGLAVVDESRGTPPDGTVKAALDLYLDQTSPDGFNAPVWGEKPINPEGLFASKDGAALTFMVEGSVLTLLTQDDERVVLTLALEQKADGTWQILYTQFEGLAHPVDGYLGRDETIFLPLAVEVSNTEGISVENPVVIAVTDDVPRIPHGSMTGMMENLGFIAQTQDIVAKIGALDLDTGFKFSDMETWGPALEKLVTIGADIGEITAAVNTMGQEVFASTLTTIDLIFGTNYTPLAGLAWDKLDFSTPAGFQASIGDLVGIIGQAFSPPANNWLAESPDHVYGGTVNADFGLDGPHPEQPLVFSARGVELMLQLFGIHETGKGWNLVVTRDHGDLETIADGGTRDEYDKLLVRDKGSEEPLMTLTTFREGDDYRYEMELHAPLAHNATIIDDLLERLATPEVIGAIGDATDTILNDLLGLGLPIRALADFVARLDGVDLSRDTFLLLPLPVVAQDADGDKTMGLVSLVVRDAVPVVIGVPEAAAVSENGLLTDGGAWTTGFIVLETFDGVGEIRLGDTVLYANGQSLGSGSGLYGGIEILAVKNLGDGICRIEYKYTLDGAVDHKAPPVGTLADETPDLRVTDAQPGPEQFIFTIRDGDGDSVTATVNVTIFDGIPTAYNETDVLDTTVFENSVAGAVWGATGNILKADGRVEQDGRSAGDDRYGPDGPAASNALVVMGYTDSGEPVPVTVGAEWTTVQGRYGALFIKADGEYEYMADPEKVNDNTTLGRESVPGSLDPDHLVSGLTPYSVSAPGHGEIKGVGLTSITFDGLHAPSSVTLGFAELLEQAKSLGIDLSSLASVAEKLGKYTATYSVTSQATVTYRLADGSTLAENVRAEHLENGVWTLTNSAILSQMDNVLSVTVTQTALGDVTAYPALGFPLNLLQEAVNSFCDRFADGMAALQTFTIDSAEALYSTEVVLDYPRDVFNYILTDQDGDQAGASLTLDTAPPLEIAQRAMMDGMGKTDADTLLPGEEGRIFDHSGATETVEISGTAYGDILRGSDFDDVIFGGPGSDFLHGGLGNDSFRWTPEDLPIAEQTFTDVIRDFNFFFDQGEGDIIDLSGIAAVANLTGVQDFDIALLEGDRDIRLSFTVEGGGTQNIVLEGGGTYATAAYGGHEGSALDAAKNLINEMIEQQQIKLICGEL